MESVIIYKYKAFSEIASSVVHEMKNPLSAITLGMEYLQLGRKDNAQQTDVIKNIASAVSRLNMMLENLHLFFSKGEDSVRKSPVKLSEVINKARSLLNYHLTRHQVQLEVKTIADEPWIIGNESQLMTFFFLAITELMPRADGGGRITFRLSSDAGGLSIEADVQGCQNTNPGVIMPGDRRIAGLFEDLAADMGGRVGFSEPGSSTPTSAWFPSGGTGR